MLDEVADDEERYDSYFKLYVWEGGKRRNFLDAWKLFLNNEHHYATQYDKNEATSRIAAVIGNLILTCG